MPDFFAERSLLEAALILAAFAIGMACVAVAAFWIPTRVLLATALVLGVFQIFVPFSYISWFLLFAISLLPKAVLRRRPGDLGLWAWLVVAVAALQAASVLWSPTIGAVAHGVLSTLALLTLFLLFAGEARREASLAFIFLVASPAVVIFAVLTWLFRLVPKIERIYLGGPLARLLSEPGVELAGQGRWLNAYDDDKAGAFMLNGNIASVFLAMCAVLYLWVFLRERGRWRWLAVGVAVLCFTAAFATGSKTPLVLAMVAPVLAVIALVFVRRVWVGAVLLAGTVAVGAAAVALAVPLGLADGFIETLETRAPYWALASRVFPDHWLLGLGFGGWDIALSDAWESLNTGGLPNNGYPPHNFLLQAWAQTGIFSAALALAVAVVPIVAIVRAMRRDRRLSLLSVTSIGDAVLLIGLIWVPAHGLTDTTTFFGDNHTIPFYAALVALALLRARGVVGPRSAAPAAQAESTRETAPPTSDAVLSQS